VTARIRQSVLDLIVVGVLLGGLVACTGSEAEKAPSSSGSGSASPSGGSAGQSAAAQELAAKYLGAQAKSAVLASVKGTIRDGVGKDVPGTLDILAIDAGENSTAVRWRLSTDNSIDAVSTNYYHEGSRPVPDTSLVALVAKSINRRYSPATWGAPESPGEECTCAYNPRALGPEGVELSSLYPALPSTVTEVELRVPGFPALAAPIARD
jgi:hypothetical protein